jgi:hypothetical protein
LKARSFSEYAIIEPPSVSESSTACSMMVSSTSSRLRLELTASPTSLSASSWSTFRASSWVLASSACTRLTLFSAIGGLAGERAEDPLGAVVEGRHLVAPQRHRPDHLVVEDHRGRHRGAEAGAFDDVAPPVVGVREDVRDLQDLAVQADPAGQRVAVGEQRVLDEVPRELVGHADGLRQPVVRPVEQVEGDGLGLAEPSGALDDGDQDPVGVAHRLADGREHLVGGVELLTDVGEVA